MDLIEKVKKLAEHKCISPRDGFVLGIDYYIEKHQFDELLQIISSDRASEVGVQPEVKQLLAEIIEHRNKLPKSWKWKKCYELEYKHYGIAKHWALENLDKQKAVASYNLLLQDLTLRRDEIDKDATMLFIEKSLEYIDALLAMVSKQSV